MPKAIENIQEEADFAKTKTGWHQRWSAELNAADKALRKFHQRGNKVVNRYVDRRGVGEEDWFKLNIFHSNIETVQAMLYGNLPKVDVSRCFADADDDVARVAGVIIERMLNYDIQRPADSYTTVLRQCLEDRLVPGLGEARIRYEVETEATEHEAINFVGDDEEVQELAPAYTEENVTYEAAIVDYIHWRDILWSPCRTYADKRWKAYRSYLTRDALVKRFGEKMGKLIPLTKSSLPNVELDYTEKDAPNSDAWARAEVWEIWSEEYMKVFWWCKDYPKILDIVDDPLELDGFYPSGMPMVANTTTSAFMPIPDYHMAQDLYTQVDKLETRISMITEAVKVVGVYDKSAEGIKRMLIEGVENDLIPVDNWAMFAEKGGINGTIDWLPIAEIAETMGHLVKQRDEHITLLNEITGMNEIMRGGTSGNNPGGPVTATESTTAARFGSVRMQALQEQFADFASSLMRLKAQVICQHFSPQTIAQQANVQHMNKADQQFIEPAMALIKSMPELLWRIEIKSENLAMVDYAILKSERTEFLMAMSQFIQAAMPLGQIEPSSIPFLLEMMKWAMAGFKGSNEIEGVMDQLLEQAQQMLQQKAEQPPEPSPEEKAAQADAEADKAKHGMQMELQQSKVQGDLQKENAKLKTKMEEIQAQLEAAIAETQAISATKISEIDAATEADILKQQVSHDLDAKAEEQETDEFIKREKAKPTPTSSS